jgi:hypothetical protein
VRGPRPAHTRRGAASLARDADALTRDGWRARRPHPAHGVKDCADDEGFFGEDSARGDLFAMSRPRDGLSRKPPRKNLRRQLARKRVGAKTRRSLTP